jgi:hypothetical protein
MMNNYIVLDGKKYTTRADSWTEIIEKPNSVRYTLTGELDITYGSSIPTIWTGEIVAPVTARALGWGTVSDLETSLVKQESVTFYDHYGSGHNVHSVMPIQGRSLSNMWDDMNNVFYVGVRLVSEGVIAET